MPAVIVPVGMMLGEYFHPQATADGPQHWHVSVAGYAQHLTHDEMQVWAAALMDPHKHAALEVNRDSLHDTLAAVPDATVSDPAPIVDDLLGRGLLVEFDPVDGDIEDFARHHRLFPLGIGLGNTGTDPFVYRIAVADEPRVGVNGDIYALWSNSLYFLNLWESCEQFAKEIAAATPADDNGSFSLDTDTIARELVTNIPLLVSSECAFLDPVPGSTLGSGP